MTVAVDRPGIPLTMVRSPEEKTFLRIRVVDLLLNQEINRINRTVHQTTFLDYCCSDDLSCKGYCGFPNVKVRDMVVGPRTYCCWGQVVPALCTAGCLAGAVSLYVVHLLGYIGIEVGLASGCVAGCSGLGLGCDTYHASKSSPRGRESVMFNCAHPIEIPEGYRRRHQLRELQRLDGHEDPSLRSVFRVVDPSPQVMRVLVERMTFVQVEVFYRALVDAGLKGLIKDALSEDYLRVLEWVQVLPSDSGRLKDQISVLSEWMVKDPSLLMVIESKLSANQRGSHRVQAALKQVREAIRGATVAREIKESVVEEEFQPWLDDPLAWLEIRVGGKGVYVRFDEFSKEPALRARAEGKLMEKASDTGNRSPILELEEREDEDIVDALRRLSMMLR
jgi:hypothetical protein